MRSSEKEEGRPSIKNTSSPLGYEDPCDIQLWSFWTFCRFQIVMSML
jgi:hypothetical protein